MHPQDRGPAAPQRGSPGAVGSPLNIKSNPDATSSHPKAASGCRPAPALAPRFAHHVRADAVPTSAQIDKNAPFFGLISAILARAKLSVRGQTRRLAETQFGSRAKEGEK